MALEIIGNGQKNPKMKKLVDRVRLDIEGGSSIYEAMSKHPVQFDELYSNLVRAGESSGSLETVLATIADYKENIETIKGKIKKAMFYQIAIIAVERIVCVILKVYGVQSLKEQLARLEDSLPAQTQRGKREWQ